MNSIKLSNQNITALGNINHLLNFSDVSILIDGQKGSGKSALIDNIEAPTIESTKRFDAKNPETFAEIKSFLFNSVDTAGIKLNELYKRVGATKTSLIILDDAMSLDKEHLIELLTTWNENKNLLRLVLADQGIGAKIKNLNVKDLNEQKLNTIFLDPMSKDEAIAFLINCYPEIQGANIAMVEKNISKITLFPGNIKNLGQRIIKHIDNDYQGVPDGSNIAAPESNNHKKNKITLEGVTADRDNLYTPKERKSVKPANLKISAIAAAITMVIIGGTYLITEGGNEQKTQENNLKIESIREKIKRNEENLKKLKQTSDSIQKLEASNKKESEEEPLTSKTVVQIENKKEEQKTVPVIKSIEEVTKKSENNETIILDSKNTQEDNTKDNETKLNSDALDKLNDIRTQSEKENKEINSQKEEEDFVLEEVKPLDNKEQTNSSKNSDNRLNELKKLREGENKKDTAETTEKENVVEDKKTSDTNNKLEENKDAITKLEELRKSIEEAPVIEKAPVEAKKEVEKQNNPVEENKAEESKIEPEPTQLTKKEKWNQSKYTIQIMSVRTEKDVEKAMKQIGNKFDVEVVKNSVEGKIRYSIVIGSFNNSHEAKITGKRIEKELSLKPWIRSTKGLLNKVVD